MAILLAYLPAGTTKTTGTAFLTSLTITKNQKLNISMSSSIACTLQVTKDGSNYYNGATFAANDAQELTLYVQAGDTLNFKQSSGNTATLGWFQVFAVDGQ